MVNPGGNAVKRGLVFASITGAFFRTAHLLAFVAKQTITEAPLFVMMETFYLVLQFG